MRGSRCRLRIFWLLPKVQNTGSPSSTAYHMATRWIVPSWLNDATFMVWRPARKASTSASVILIWSRRDMGRVSTACRCRARCPASNSSGATGQSVRRSASAGDSSPRGTAHPVDEG